MYMTAVNMLSTMWRPGSTTNEIEIIKFTIPPNLMAFTSKYDKTQEQLQTLGTLDDLLAGTNVDTCTLMHL